MRGEYFINYIIPRIKAGSPPLARGVLNISPSPVRSQGITPACAGSTLPEIDRLLPPQDHPRLRGEYIRRRRFQKSHTGSPPLARGVPTRSTTACLEYRITPACAGSTLKKACIYVILVFYLSIFHLT